MILPGRPDLGFWKFAFKLKSPPQDREAALNVPILSRSSRPRERYYNNPDIKRIYLLFGLGTLNALLACLSPCPPSKHCYSRCPRSLSLTYLSTRLTGKHWAAPYASSLLA